MPSPKRPLRPEVRPVETIVVPDRVHGRVLVLRDTQGIAPGHAVIPPAYLPIVSRFDGKHTAAEIAKQASAEIGQEVPIELVDRMIGELDDALFLFGDRFDRERANTELAFANAAVRPASHAGGAYHGDRNELVKYLDDDCMNAPSARRTRPSGQGKKSNNGNAVVGLVAPHIDPWRGALGYGRSYGALRDGIHDDADTFIVFGTSHAPMREPFSICPKAFATPLGDVQADLDACQKLARAAKFDPHADLFNHKREHSIEFQVLFLRHVLGKRPLRIVPILAGLNRQQMTKRDPAHDAGVENFLAAIREMVAARPGRVVVVAGADMAHVGPRFGDPKPHDALQRASLEKRDRASLDVASPAEAASFWEHVAADLDERRVCGLAPIYSLLRVLPESADGSLVHYEQTVDEEDGSIVSHAGIAFESGAG